MGYIDDVFRQTADGGYFDFARCQRDDGTIYASPTDTCRKGKKIDADSAGNVKKPAKSSDKMQLTAKIKAMSAADLKKVAADPRLSDRQKKKLNRLIKAKVAEEKLSTGAKVMQKNGRVGRTTQQEVDRQMLRGEVKLDAKELETNAMYQGKTPETLSTLKSSYKNMQSMMKDPYFNTPANRARVINTRIAIWRTEKAIREATATTRIDPKTYEKDLENSPKYKSTPGSTKAIAKAKSEDLPELEKRMRSLSAQLSDPSLSQEKAIKVSDEMLDLNRRIRVAKGESGTAAPNLKKIYEEQGFNAKPELVATATDLNKRKDLLTNPDGTNVVLYRGVTTEEFSNQFKGLGPDGNQHFAGRGIFGNGSYAGAAAFDDPGGTADAGKNVAAAYAGERKNLAAKVTAFGLRKDANVITFEGDSNERGAKYTQWFDRTLKEAEEKTGYKFNDVGEAAAALGIHAYQVPQRGGDYYVVLNRGAVVAAMDSELADNTGQ